MSNINLEKLEFRFVHIPQDGNEYNTKTLIDKSYDNDEYDFVSIIKRNRKFMIVVIQER